MQPGQVFVSAQDATVPQQPVFTPNLPPNVAPGQVNVSSGRRKLPVQKPVLMGLIAVLVIGLGYAAYWFGYKTNSSLVYSQALSNTGKGYNKLIDYVDKQSAAKSQGYVGSGSFRYKSAGMAADGNIDFKGNDKNSALSFDIGAVGQRV
jgi:hypothetical protein